ncbi:hypothetical protein AB0I28_32790 [Phytomonospora sp. NPDC050363]|uniref:hypothetical protein n=1 Tax=Phytomonospora sp. NPDC050363 TaxID=3155642 RepID=UPI003403990F
MPADTLARRLPPGAFMVRKNRWLAGWAATAVRERRVDWQRSVRQVVDRLCKAQNHESHQITITQKRLAALTGLSKRTVVRVMEWLQDQGVLYCIEAGASKVIFGGDKGRAATYVVLDPARREQPETPVSAQVKAGSGTPTPERSEGDDDSGGAENLHKGSTSSKSKTDPLWDRRNPISYSARVKVVSRLRSFASWRAAEVEELVGMLGMWFDAGWCAAAIMHAVDNRPNAKKRSWAKPPHLRSLIGWIGSRLRYWLDEDRRPLPAPVPAVTAYARARELVPTSPAGTAASPEHIRAVREEQATKLAAALAKARTRPAVANPAATEAEPVTCRIVVAELTAGTAKRPSAPAAGEQPSPSSGYLAVIAAIGPPPSVSRTARKNPAVDPARARRIVVPAPRRRLS